MMTKLCWLLRISFLRSESKRSCGKPYRGLSDEKIAKKQSRESHHKRWSSFEYEYTVTTANFTLVCLRLRAGKEGYTVLEVPIF